MKFSERQGLASVSDAIQTDGVDEALRNGLWSLLQIRIWNDVHEGHHSHALAARENQQLKRLLFKLKLHFFKEPIDTLTNNWKTELRDIRTYFFRAEWFVIYDFVEFCGNSYLKRDFQPAFWSEVNVLLEREHSGFRVVDGLVAPIIEKASIESVERALAGDANPVRDHLRRALELMTSRDAPDYRNSVKESISAIESLVSITLGETKGTFGQLLKQLEIGPGLHPALRTGFSNLYGYASDEGGVRHAMLEAPRVSYEDAQFMLVACSAFINYVRARTTNATS